MKNFFIALVTCLAVVLPAGSQERPRSGGGGPSNTNALTNNETRAVTFQNGQTITAGNLTVFGGNIETTFGYYLGDGSQLSGIVATATNLPAGSYAFPRPTTNVSDAASLIAAVNYSSAGTVVGIRPGTYAIGTNNLVPPDGVSVVGSSTDPRDVILFGYADCWGVETYSQGSGGPQLSPGNNQFIGGFTLRCDTNTMLSLLTVNYGTNVPHSHMWAGFGMSVLNPPTNRKSTNTVVRNVIVERGYFDCFHLNNNYDKQNEITFIDCHAETEGLAWDFWSATGGGTNSVYNLVNCSGTTRGQIPQALIDDLAFFDPLVILLVDGVTVNAVNFQGRAAFASGAFTNLAGAIGADASSRLHLSGGKFTINLPWNRDYTNQSVLGNYTFNTTNINRLRSDGVRIDRTGYSVTLGESVSVPSTGFALKYQDEFDTYDLLTWTGGGGWVLDPNSPLRANLKNGTNYMDIKVWRGTFNYNGGITTVAMQNTLAGNTTFGRTATGHYYVTNSAGGFTTNKTWAIFQNGRPVAPGYASDFSVVRSNNFVLGLFSGQVDMTLSDISLADDWAQNAKLEILVYP